MRESIRAKFLTIDEALDRALAIEGGPVVIADTADNAGGGAPGDSTFVLHRMLERGISDAVSGYYWDPVAVRFCVDAGVGATFALRLGGKTGKSSGDPIDLVVTVRGLAENVTQRFGASRGAILVAGVMPREESGSEASRWTWRPGWPSCSGHSRPRPPTAKPLGRRSRTLS